jgi:hypothetical protein
MIVGMLVVVVRVWIADRKVPAKRIIVGTASCFPSGRFGRSTGNTL